MDQQKWYESARLLVDEVIDNCFEELSPEANRKLARIWQYLRDQEIVAIQSKLRERPPSRSVLPIPGLIVQSYGASD